MENILRLLGSAYSDRLSNRPWITLTWAQSLDGKLSASCTAQTLISSPPSMQLTHALRAIHDAILVGSNTVVIDNPRLTTRLSPSTVTVLQQVSPLFSKNADNVCNPIPVILDSRLRTKPTARFLHQERLNSHKPFIFTSPNSSENASLSAVAQVHSVQTPDAASGYLHLPSVLDQLSHQNIDSVMVEGGTSILSSFIAAGLFDVVIITVAPAIFGQGPALHAPKQAPDCFANMRFVRSEWVQLGDDCILIAFPK